MLKKLVKHPTLMHKRRKLRTFVPRNINRAHR